MKTMTRLGKGVIGAVVSFALFIGCLPITAIPVLAAEGDTPAVITLGGTSTGTSNYTPTRTRARYSVSEWIYSASELGNAGGTISSVAFYKTSGSSTNRNLRVYLVDTDKTSFNQTNDWINSATLCYQGSVALSTTGWITINFTTSFTHAADKNLAVIVIDYTNRATNSDRTFRTYTATGQSNVCIYANGNSAYTMGSLSANYTRQNAKPAIQISILKNMTVTAPDVTVAWDGDAHGLTVTATDAGSGATISGATVMYGTSAGVYDQSSLEYTDAGTYDIYYQVKASGYATVTGSATVVINSIGTVECNAEDVSVTYDGQPHGIEVQVTTPTTGYTIEYRTDPTAEWTSTNPTVTDVTDEAVTVYYRVSAPGYTAATGSATVAINAPSGTSYIDENGNTQYADATELTSNTRNWADGSWYVVPEGGVTISNRITVSGTVNLILRDGATLTASQGITTSNATLNIYAQSAGTGKLIATGTAGYNAPGSAGIGGNASTTGTAGAGGTLNIYGGIITATGGTGAYRTGGGAGIGGAGGRNSTYYGNGGAGGTVSIYGGTVTATGGNGGTDAGAGAGIGGGGKGRNAQNGNNGTLTLGAGVILYQGTSSTGTVLDGNDSQSRTYSGTRPQNMYAERLKTIEFTADGYSDIYDGDPHGIDVQVTAPASGYTIEYTLDDPESSTAQWTTTNPTETDVTDEAVTVYFRITASGYKTETGSATIVINPIGTVECNAENVSVTYDGQPHEIDVQVTTPTSGSTIEYRTDPTAEWTSTNPTVTDVTVEAVTVYYRVSAPGYTAATGSADIVITPATITYTAEDFTTTYDGGFYGINVQVTAPTSGSSIQYRYDDVTEWSTVNPTFTTGTHTVYFQISAPNYTTTEVDSRTVTINNDTMQYSASGTTTTYDGNSYGISVSVTKPASGATILYSETEGVFDPTATTSPTYSAAGTHTVYYQISATGYDTITGSANVVINEATISYTASDYSAAYDGAAHGITVTVNTPSGATVRYGTQAGVYNLDTSPTLTNVGSQTVYFQITAPNYKTVTGHKTITITPATIVYTAGNYSAAYDGQPHGITLNVTTPADATVEYRTSRWDQWTTTAPTRTDVTSGAVTVYWRITANNYEQAEGSNTITISNATISYTAESYSGVYDGEAHSITVDVTAPANARVQYRTNPRGQWSDRAPTQTNVTNGPVTVYYQITADNYTTVSSSETITITPATIAYTAEGYTGTYDGNEHNITVTVNTPSTGATVRYRTRTSDPWSETLPTYTAAGTYLVYYQISANNYTTVESSATVSIANADMTVTADDVTAVYDGEEYSIAVVVTKPAGDYTIMYGTVEGVYNLDTAPAFTNVGTNTVYYQVTAANYNAFTGSATVTISNATMTVEATGYSAPYDGEAHGIEVNVITPASGATVLYGESEDACTETTSPTYSYGEHTVYFVVSADNYNDYTGSATVVISDIDIAATAEGYDGPYDGEAHGITVTVTEPESGASVMFGTEEGTYDMEVSPVFTEIGDYTVYYQVTAEGHNPLTGSATVSIGELTIDATVTPYDGVFDGAEHGVTVTVNTPEVGATVLFGTEAGVYDLDESPTYCEIGTYTVYYKISAEYYAPLEGSVVVRISENPDRDNAREALIELIAASDEILAEWEDLLPEDLVEALLDAEDAAYEVLNNEIASIEQLEAAADNLANALGNVLQYIAENYETEPELTPEQRTRLCVINFVENLYLHALGRPFDVSGRDTWVSLIMDQGGTGTQVARGFLGSQEFLGLGLDNEGFVKALYNALFNRVPEAEEVDTWTNALAAGVTREEVINAFFASPEWARTCAYYRVNI